MTTRSTVNFLHTRLNFSQQTGQLWICIGERADGRNSGLGGSFPTLREKAWARAKANKRHDTETRTHWGGAQICTRTLATTQPLRRRKTTAVPFSLLASAASNPRVALRPKNRPPSARSKTLHGMNNTALLVFGGKPFVGLTPYKGQTTQMIQEGKINKKKQSHSKSVLLPACNYSCQQSFAYC